jgi:D-sedoheptulose 7-phosphate isomerase
VNYSRKYLEGTQKIAMLLESEKIENMVSMLLDIRKKGGRLFFIGVGGGAGNAAHAVNDFRKIAGFEAYAPTDNVSELTARVNDDGWETVFASWLKGSRLNKNDALFIFSVGGGNIEKNISANIVRALEYGRSIGVKIFGIVGRDAGYTKQVADACILVPTIDPDMVTPFTEAFQSVIWHLLVSHPLLKTYDMKWESME